MARAIWKGAISFGLVHIPVSLVSATTSSGIDFDWLDERSMDPVGYKRINKTTGKEVAPEHIVKGIAYEKGATSSSVRRRSRRPCPKRRRPSISSPSSTARTFRC